MKNTLLLIILLAFAALSANYEYYPLTSLAEAGVIANNATCDYAYNSLNTVLGQSNRGEFIATRLYHASGDLSNPSAEQRFLEYSITTVPTVVFNGNIHLIGATPASAIQELLSPSLFSASPLKIDITGFSTASGNLSGTVTMLDSTLVLTDHSLVFFLVEDNVGAATNVTRQVLTQSISISGAGTQVNFNASFTLNATWNVNNLWAIVSVQADNNQILQNTSTLSLPEFSLRCAMDWDQHGLVVPPNSSLTSSPLWVFNTGSSDDMTIRIILDEAPADWFFNYCDEVGNCYPGDFNAPLSMNAEEAKAFHLNLWVGSTGIARFHFRISSPNLGEFTVPFTCRTSDYVSNDDQILSASLSLSANYPNPFRGDTSFRVASAKAESQTSVQIFNLKGQKIAETPVQNLRQGENTITWQAPENLSAGVYFYRLKDVPSSMRRMLLLK